LLLSSFFIALVLGIAACGSANPARNPGRAAGITLSASTTPTLGQILIDPTGRTLYIFALDTGSTSKCADACAAAWPPAVTPGPTRAGAGVDPAKLGTTTRPDGSLEVTYGGHPLYYYAGDSKPGDATGQNLNQFGAKWYVVSPTGTPITS
jgi:predicted lipoprotein with Yx(FWY)xxD motif